jgi:predicted nucleic acid-binding protein
MFLPDIDFWLALAFESHLHHAAANNWFDSASGDQPRTHIS